MMENLDDEIESVLYICREVSVYKVPPLKKNEGYRANDWGNLADPLWKGRLRIIEKSTSAILHLEDGQTGELFAKTEYSPDKPPVEAVLDSSRYFVVRIEDDGKKAYIGLGFAERSESFDFNVALQDCTKRYFTRMNPEVSSDGTSPHLPAGPKKDYSLKEGQTFTISIPGKKMKSNQENFPTENLLGSASVTTSLDKKGTSDGDAIPLLPPPPGAGRRS